MKPYYNTQERIRQIMARIEAELYNSNQIVKLPKPASKQTSSSSTDHKTNRPNDKEIELSNLYKQRAIKAFKQKKIFTIHGNYRTVRSALLRRGWIEKCSPGRIQKLEKMSQMQLLKGARKGNDFETAFLSKMVQPYAPNFVWQPKYFKDQYTEANPLRNRVRRTRCLDFSTKVGLIGCFENSHWNTIEDVAEAVYIPSYKLATRDDEIAFLHDFRITQCISLLAHFLETEPPDIVFDRNGVVPISVLEFAIKTVKEYCEALDGVFLEMPLESTDAANWKGFSHNSHLLLKKDQKIVGSDEDCSRFLKLAQEALQTIEKFKPFWSSYGCRNLWILKPGFQCRGQGIVIMDDPRSIVNYAAERPKSNYIVQKYIEKPLLIYKTKFDIRQYMLVTIFDEINIWMYKDCYLRFSSREYSLGDLRESIHITNNSIQKKYKNAERDARLPGQNMWDLAEFRSYLKEQNCGEAWDEKIYPAFKKNLLSVVLSSLEETDLTRNSFELYGCDFMLNERLDPFLIEINSTPDLSPSTLVTAQICPSALEDLMKVVIDHRNNSNILTGKFELIHKISCPRTCNNLTNFVLEGRAKKLHSPPVSLNRKMKIRRFIKRKVFRKKSLVSKVN